MFNQEKKDGLMMQQNPGMTGGQSLLTPLASTHYKKDYTHVVPGMEVVWGRCGQELPRISRYGQEQCASWEIVPAGIDQSDKV